MIQCRKCGANQIDTNKKCVFCGADLTNQSAQHLKTKEPNCSNDLFNNQQMNFGNSDDKFPYYQADKERNNKRAPIFLMAVCIGIAILIILFVMKFSTMTKKSVDSVPHDMPPAEKQLNLNTDNKPLTLNTDNKPPVKAVPLNRKELIDVYDLDHSMVLEEIKKNNNIIQLNPEDIKNKPKEIQNMLITKLTDNKICHDNSEDFIIHMNGDLKSFQKALKEIDYQQLHKLLAQIHIEGSACKGNKPTASWAETKIKGFGRSRYNNDRPENHLTHYCSNKMFYKDNSLLDISLAFYFITYEESKYRGMFVSLEWETNRVGTFRFFEPDDTMDPHIVVAFKNQFNEVDFPVIDNKRVMLLQSKYKDNIPILNNLMQSNDFQVVYGRYVKDDEDGYYYVLSYRKYSLDDMNLECPFVRDELTKILINLDPDIRHKETDIRPKDSTTKLPF